MRPGGRRGRREGRPAEPGACVLRRTRRTWPVRRTSRAAWCLRPAAHAADVADPQDVPRGLVLASCGARGRCGRSAGRPARSGACVLRRTRPMWPLRRTSRSSCCLRPAAHAVDVASPQDVPLLLVLASCGARGGRGQSAGRPAPPAACVLRRTRSMWPLRRTSRPGPTLRPAAYVVEVAALQDVPLEALRQTSQAAAGAAAHDVAPRRRSDVHQGAPSRRPQDVRRPAQAPPRRALRSRQEARGSDSPGSSSTASSPPPQQLSRSRTVGGRG